jgi:hypothetical protein
MAKVGSQELKAESKKQKPPYAGARMPDQSSVHAKIEVRSEFGDPKLRTDFRTLALHFQLLTFNLLEDGRCPQKW